MTSNQKNAFKLGAGLLAGAAATYYLNNTQQGRQLRKAATDTIREQSGTVSSLLNTAFTSARSYVNDMLGVASEKADQFSDTAKDTSRRLESSFEKGVDKARTLINQPVPEVEISGNGHF